MIALSFVAKGIVLYSYTLVPDASCPNTPVSVANWCVPQIMLVITGGNANCGFYTPRDAADLARSYGMDIYAVGVGTGVNADQQKVRQRPTILSVAVCRSCLGLF